MKQIPAAKLKEQCLSLLDRVGPEGIIITKRGKAVAKLIPIRTESANLIGLFKGKLKVKGYAHLDPRFHRRSARARGQPVALAPLGDLCGPLAATLLDGRAGRGVACPRPQRTGERGAADR